MNGKKKKGPLSCINGVKGAISLFMAVLMTPFLSIALLLVETGRYNSAVSLLDEAMGVSAVSTLANYDQYLKDRWGLLAFNQEHDLEDMYTSYLEVNTDTITTIDLSNTTASGIYPLSDTEVLKSQIMEYSKLNAPTKLGTELAATLNDVFQFTEKIKSSIKAIEDVSSLLGSGAEVLDGAITLTESSEKMAESARKLDGLKTEYENKYVAFESEVNTLIGYLQEKASIEAQLRQKRDELNRLHQELSELLNEEATTPTETTDPSETTEPTETTAPTEATEPPEESEEVKAKRAEIDRVEQEISDLNNSLTLVNRNISSGITAAKTAQTEYATVLTTIADELQNFRELASAAQEAMQNVQQNILSAAGTLTQIISDLEANRTKLKEKEEDLEQFKKELETWEKEGHSLDDPSYIAGLEYKIALEEEVEALQRENAELERQAALYETANKGLGEMHDGMSTSFEDYSDATIGAVIESFRALCTKVQQLNVDGLTASSPLITRPEYRYLEVAGYINADEIDAYLKKQEDELKSGSLSALLDGLVAVYNSIMGLSVFFEDKLDAYIDLSYYEEEFGGLPGGTDNSGEALGLVTSLGSLIGSAVTFQSHLMQLKLLDLLTDAKKIVTDAIKFVESLISFTYTILTNIAELVTGLDRWYLGTYCSYNLACREDFDNATGEISITTMNGTRVGEDSFPKAATRINVPVFGELYKLIETITTAMNKTGSDRTFSGAEVEYILFGSTSEVANQLYTFAVIYLLRVLLCIPSISANAEVQAMAAAATLGYPVVMALYYFLEPLVQTVLLANGKPQDLISKTVYLSPSGLPSLLKELVAFCDFTTKQEEELRDKMIGAFSKSQGDYDYQKKLFEYEGVSLDTSSLSLSYRDYCLFWMLLTVSKDAMLNRLSNLIQMETLYYYEQQGASYTFDLKQCPTFIHAQTDVSVVQIMPTLISSDLFSIQREQFRGY